MPLQEARLIFGTPCKTSPTTCKTPLSLSNNPRLHRYTYSPYPGLKVQKKTSALSQADLGLESQASTAVLEARLVWRIPDCNPSYGFLILLYNFRRRLFLSEGRKYLETSPSQITERTLYWTWTHASHQNPWSFMPEEQRKKEKPINTLIRKRQME